MSRPTRILIVGGGFGAVNTALTLKKRLKAEIRRGEVELDLDHWSVASTAGFGSRQHHPHDDHLVIALGK